MRANLDFHCLSGYRYDGGNQSNSCNSKKNATEACGDFVSGFLDQKTDSGNFAFGQSTGGGPPTKLRLTLRFG